MPMPPMPTKWMRLTFLMNKVFLLYSLPSIRRHSSTIRAAASRTPTAAWPAPWRAAAPGRPPARRSPGPIAGRVSGLLLDDQRATAIGKPACVDALVIPGSVRERHEDRGAAVRRDLRDRPGAGSRDHQVGRTVALAHRVEEGGNLGAQASIPIGGSHGLALGVAALMDEGDVEPSRGEQPAGRRRPAGSPRALPGSRRARAGAGRRRARPRAPAPSASSRTGLPARTARPAGK